MPLILRELARRIRELDPDVQFYDDGGRHPYYFERGDRRCYPMKAHNGVKSKVDDLIIRKLCRFLGLDFDDVMGRGARGKKIADQVLVDEPTPPPGPPPVQPVNSNAKPPTDK